MVLAAQALQKEMEAFTIAVDGQSRRGPFHRSLTSAALDAKALTLRNESGADMRVILNVSGIPLRPSPPSRRAMASSGAISPSRGRKSGRTSSARTSATS